MNTSNSSCSTPLHPPHRHARKKTQWTILCWFQSSSDHITVDWLPEELLRAREKTAGKQDGGGRLVEQLECPVVDRDLIHLMARQMFNRFNGPPNLPQRRTWWLWWQHLGAQPWWFPFKTGKPTRVFTSSLQLHRRRKITWPQADLSLPAKLFTTRPHSFPGAQKLDRAQKT